MLAPQTVEGNAWLAKQRRIYGQRYRCFRRVHDVLRYDARYRLFLLEEAFRRFDIPFERQKVFELGFGTGSLLLRFDTSCTLHGSELSESAVLGLSTDPRVRGYREVCFVQNHADGSPHFPSSDYDIVLASHVIEHVPDDRAALVAICERLKPEGHAVFFLPLERPRHNPDHARTYTRAGFSRLLREEGFELLYAEENFRYASHLVQVINWPSRARLPVIGPVVEVSKTLLLALPPTSFVRLAEKPLERLFVAPRQLMVLAKKAAPATGCATRGGTGASPHSAS